jgi:hypothetical protein
MEKRLWILFDPFAVHEDVRIADFKVSGKLGTIFIQVNFSYLTTAILEISKNQKENNKGVEEEDKNQELIETHK